jgi:hypothetical protein
MEENREEINRPTSPDAFSSAKAAKNEPSKKSARDIWEELAKLALLALVVVVPFRLYVAQPFIVDGASMDPTFKDGQYLVVDELSYHFRAPERGEVLIFKFPKDPSNNNHLTGTSKRTHFRRTLCKAHQSRLFQTNIERR